MKMWLILLTTVIFASANKSSGNNVTPGTTIIPPSTDVPVSEMPPSGLPGLLYPRESESREVKSLDGLWDFLKPPSYDIEKGMREEWHKSDISQMDEVIKMPVPSSYNDITTSEELRDYVGFIWYQRSFFVPASWSDKRVFIRFGSINYSAQIWINGVVVGNHEMGHLPFEIEITNFLSYGGSNRITVAVDNMLSSTSIPQGSVINKPTDNGSVLVQYYSFDFFNYAGIHRSVLLHTKPRLFIDDITVKTGINNDLSLVKYLIKTSGELEKENPVCEVKLLDANNNLVATETTTTLNIYGSLEIMNANLWWPRGMSDTPGYMYTLEFELSSDRQTEPDIYRMPIGIRTLRWTNTSFLINNKPIYFRGFGRHEDSAIRGRGFDYVTMIRDYELLKWVGANAYRTSHYPYSDEVLDMADRLGIMIIDECPSVDTEKYSPSLLIKHKQSLSELIRRDKNHPSVVMWSIANEPRTQLSAAEDYFKRVAHHVKTLDRTRPITLSVARGVQEDKACQFLDIISFNRYNAWYHDSGRLDMISTNVETEATEWHMKHNKPVLMSEYGADTMPGLHELPAYIWSEEYQKQLLSKHFVAFDRLRARGFFIGEFIWNFADFRTAQTYTRVGGNKKGIFTRDRQPKMAAHHVRKRYHELGSIIDGTPLPNFELYTSDLSL